ncbi:hypothetical protein MKW94_004571 [Papaver nudicaule]|uniref:Uncharacterized protein n=1 Tax=Papaver nudicaule TaxID=74823 RepID=A0AA41V993_PAPNU|nr:hypothetical protein [Papaver nudicaule]
MFKVVALAVSLPEVQSADRRVTFRKQKLLGILIAVGEAVAYILSRMFVSVGQLGVGNAIGFINQLFIAGIVVICLDELLQKRYGAFSPTTINSGEEAEFEGVVVALFRQMRYVLCAKHSTGRTFQICFNMPIIPQPTLVSNLLKYNFLVNLLGKQKESEYSGGQFISVGGMAYYITAPSSLADMVSSPFHALFYLIFMLSACALCSLRLGLKFLDPLLEMWLNTLRVSAYFMGSSGSGSGFLFAVTTIH